MTVAEGSAARSFFGVLWHYGRWVLLALLLAYAGLVIYRIPAVREKDMTAQAVQQIEATHLTMDDVDGQHLPPPPDPKQNDATIAGIDANGNGIRDDVELAIFQKYPGDSNLKLRAAELQYAMALQMYLQDIPNSDVLVAVAQQEERASSCVSDQVPKDDIQTYYSQVRNFEDYVKSLVINTNARKMKANENTQLTKSFSSLSGSDCDVSTANS